MGKKYADSCRIMRKNIVRSTEMEQKTLKQYAKEAKKRLKNGFWQNYERDLNEKISMAKEAGVSPSKVKEYYADVVSENIRSNKEDDEEFYRRVKKILDEEGEIYNAIGRLTDKAAYDAMNYEERQRYNLSLSEKYLKAVERYNREKSLSFSDAN